MAVEDLNWDYWEWFRRNRKPKIMLVEERGESTVLRRVEDLPIVNNQLLVEVIENMADRIETVDRDVAGLRNDMQGVEEKITIPMMSLIEERSSRILGEISSLRGDISSIKGEISTIKNDISTIRSDTESLGEMLISELLNQAKDDRKIVREELTLPVIKDAHRTMVNYLISKNSLLSYSEISKSLNIAKSSVRVYIADLQNWGFPLTKSEKDGRILVGIFQESAEQTKELLNKFS